MAKRKGGRTKKSVKPASRRKLAKRPSKRAAPKRTARPPKRAARSAQRTARPAKPARPRKAPAKSAPARRAPARAVAARRGAGARHQKTPRLDRVRRTLDETNEDVVPTPPSSLNMDRHGSAARTGRADMEAARHNHATMAPEITAGDVDVDVEDAYFTGDEAPGGDNPSPDQDIVDDIGKALGVQYDDNEELKSGDKITERDKHRWEWDPASSEDYKDRK
jgi:Family of unknown function (DUF6335)